MNLIDASIVKTDTGLAAELSGGQMVPVTSNHPHIREHEEVIVGMRPEHFAMGGGGVPLSGSATLVEPTGAQTHITFDLGDKPATAVLDGGVDVAVGQPLTVSIDPLKVHFFDRTTGRRV